MLSVFQSRWNLGLIALVGAWLLVLGLLGAAVGYVAYQRLSHEAPESQLAEAESAAEESQPAASDGTASDTAASDATASDTGDSGGTESTDAAAPDPETAAEDAAGTEQAGADPPEADGGETDGEAGDGTGDDVAAADAEAVEAVVSEEEAPEGAQPAQTAGEGEDAAARAAAETRQEATLPPAEATAVEEPPAGEAPHGEPPWQHYAIPFDRDRAGPRIAVVMAGLGLSAAATEAAIKQLPPTVTLSFSPYARLLNQWIALARVNGHEVMLDLPMEPVTDDDPGPHALMTVLDKAQNLKRLDWLLKRGNSYVGVAGMMGSRFAASQEHMAPILENLNERGLLFLDNRSTEESTASTLAQNIGLPHVVNDRTLDAAQASRLAINARLSEIERLARENGAAVAMAQPYPVTIERLRDWAVDIESRGFVLTPITALAD